ncbi:MAG TPA: SAM-dependent methyltransferase [Anaerolineae bacterium]|nr:SAM-dependent methyltransferase [Anaerolineae bacterium]HQI83053.1 SAM-dependent methyltransferase [Anaerolineae bacterium]
MLQTDHRAILTSSPTSGHAALNEIRALVPGARLLRWLEPGVGLLEFEIDWNTLAVRLREQLPVFCRHICPIQAHVPLRQIATDLDALAQASRQFIPLLDVTHPFSVQTRLFDEGWPYARYDVNERLSQMLIEHGLALDVRCPEQVFSVVLTPGEGYLGVSRAVDNLSDWAGGVRRFRWEPEQISRAEFKLLEALEVFKLHLPAGGVALDLGAAPGGWTRIARQHGLRVIAVDPGDLDQRIAADPLVRHIRQTAQSYLPKTTVQFDIILNDMRMDARDSAQIMLAALDHLRADGWALLTLKLPERKAEVVAAAALALLRADCHVIGARQLFHNRSEITVALKAGFQ